MKLLCDNCGKWVMIIRSTPTALQEAEERDQSEVAVDESKLTDATQIRTSCWTISAMWMMGRKS